MEIEFKNGKFHKGNELEFLSYIVEEVGVSIHILEINNRHGTLPVWMNAGYKLLTGLSYEDRMKIGYSNDNEIFYHPDDLKHIGEGIKKLFGGYLKCFTTPFRAKTKFGNWKWYFTNVKEISINGKSNHLLCVMMDVEQMKIDYSELVQKYSKEVTMLKRQLAIQKLTKTELLIIEYVCHGLTVKEIAEKRCRSAETINNHKRNIFSKLNINKTTELVSYAAENGLI